MNPDRYRLVLHYAWQLQSAAPYWMEAQDVAHEACLKLMTRRFRKEPNSTLIKLIVTNTVRDCWEKHIARKNVDNKTVPFDVAVTNGSCCSPEEVLILQQEYQQCENNLAILRECIEEYEQHLGERPKIYLAAWLAGESPKRIAKRYGVAASTVSSRITYMRHQLAHQFFQKKGVC